MDTGSRWTRRMAIGALIGALAVSACGTPVETVTGTTTGGDPATELRQQAEADHAEQTREAEIEKLRADQLVASEASRHTAQSAVADRTDRFALSESIRYPADTLTSEIEVLRAKARVASDSLRLADEPVVVWTERGPVEVPAATGHQAAAGGPRTCIAPMIVSHTPGQVVEGAGQCPALSDLWVTPRPQVTISALSMEQVERIPWAIETFARAGLHLPAVEFRGQATRESCSGRDGAARHENGSTTIYICRPDTGPTWDWLLLHELGHAWSRWNLDTETRELFLAVRGLAHWDRGPWHERGAEHASEILVWGLIDRPVEPGHMYNTTCMELEVGYQALTGFDPLHGFHHACA